MVEKFSYNVINWVYDNDIDEHPVGVVVQVDNGDTQYLTVDQYELLKQNTNESSFS